MKKISCIIPAYNEGKRIESVLKAVYKHPLIDEVIVVDDGSTDNTQKLVKKFKGIKLIVNEKNRGKSFSIVNGITNSKNDLLMFIDSDLKGLKKEDITKLIEPVQKGEADVSISLRKNSLKIYKMIGLDFISGERVFPKNLIIDQLEKILKLPGFGLEVFLNKLIIKHSLRIKVVYWKNVISPRKSKKVGLIKGWEGDLLMFKDMMKTISLKCLIDQNLKMLKLMVKD